MKRILLLIFMLTWSTIYSQVNPTLGIGLEALTLNKGTIDVEVLTKVILKKQKELKNEALKRFMLKMFPDTNYTTRFYVQNCLNILLNEKNPQVIEKEILELTTNYAIALGVTKAVLDQDEIIFSASVSKSNNKNNYEKTLNDLEYESEIEVIKIKTHNITTENKKIIGLEKTKQNLTEIKLSVKKIKDYQDDIKKIKRKLSRNGVSFNLSDSNSIYSTDVNQLNFGEKLDLVSLALSENDLLRKKGFFKNKIDYRDDQGYFYDQKNDGAIVDSITKKINPFIENYDIIKNFLENVDTKGFNNITDELKKIYIKQLNFDDFSSYIDDKDLKNNLKDVVGKLDNLIHLKDDYLKLNELKSSIKPLKITSTSEYLEKINDIVLKYNNYITRIDTINSTIDGKKIAKNFKIKTAVINEIEYEKKGDVTKNPPLLVDLDKDIENAKALEKELLALQARATQNDSIANVNILQKKQAILTIIDKYKTEKITSVLDEVTENLKKFDENEIIKNISIEIDTLQKNISSSHVFFTVFINKLLEKIEKNSFEAKKDQKTTIQVNTQVNSENKLQKTEENSKELSELIAKIYERLLFFKNNKNYTISDIKYLENELLSQLVGLKYTDINKNQEIYNQLIKGIKNLTPLLKIRILFLKQLDIKTNEYTNLISLFEFVGNLDKLNRAQTYSSIVDLIKKNSEEITDILPEGEFKEGYALFINGVKKYTLISTDTENEYVEIDVVSFLNDLQQHYQRNNPSSFSLYLSLGLNQNMFINKFQFSDSDETLSSIGFASEKIGVKLKILDFKKYRGYENAIKSDIYLNKRAPFINEWYATVYGSGLLYSLANTTTNQNFNFPHVGVATGFRFYNALDFNLMLGLPFIKDQKFGNNGFIGIGFDIPLGEYLEALGNK